jgi:hypothetical protein
LKFSETLIKGYYYNYGKHLFWRMAQPDWLLMGRDFPILPTGNTPIFYCPVGKQSRKTLAKFYLLKLKSVKMGEVQYNNLV